MFNLDLKQWDFLTIFDNKSFFSDFVALQDSKVKRFSLEQELFQISKLQTNEEILKMMERLFERFFVAEFITLFFQFVRSYMNLFDKNNPIVDDHQVMQNYWVFVIYLKNNVTDFNKFVLYLNKCVYLKQVGFRAK